MRIGIHTGPVVVGALGEKQIKGKKEPVTIYKLLSAKEELYRPRLGFERMIYSEMVGRDTKDTLGKCVSPWSQGDGRQNN
jgi:hypothetical protein